LQCAAVIGRQFSRPLLEAIMGDRHKDLDGGLDRLQSLEFLYETNLFPEIEYTFKHVLTQEVAYDSLLQDRRRALHSRILGAIESPPANQLTPEGDRLAHQALRGEVWDRAARYARHAGDKAAGYSANREAVGFYEQALAALEHLPEDRPAMEQAIDIRLDLRRTLVPLADKSPDPRPHAEGRSAGAAHRRSPPAELGGLRHGPLLLSRPRAGAIGGGEQARSRPGRAHGPCSRGRGEPSPWALAPLHG